ncbi:hypothetical protein [Brevibacterium yomogidense]|uniref:hypothetical protein n=1 Tax=Brevibacterium yomogidense TaxID=946573 RepID=UPI0011776F9D|nr:hypothetical protein [Brevibacterium yomogidense]
MKDAKRFTTSDMGHVMAEANLFTAYGYTGDKALEITSSRSDSLNSTKMNMKMYAEVFRMLGWVAPADRSASYPLAFTFIGSCAGNSTFAGALALAEESLLGFVNPTENSQNVKYTENVRFYPLVLRALRDLGGTMYKHELCLGPMSCDDIDESSYDGMIEKIKSLRGDYSRLSDAFNDLCQRLNMKPTSVDNSTRLPIGQLSGHGWIETGIRDRTLYNRSLSCIKITDKGATKLREYLSMVDLRLSDFNALEPNLKAPAIRAGVYSMLERAGFNVDSVRARRKSDSDALAPLLKGRELNFSPYQTLWPDTVNEALGLTPDIRNQEVVQETAKHETHSDKRESSIESTFEGTILGASAFAHTSEKLPVAERPSLIELRGLIEDAVAKTSTIADASRLLFNSRVNDKQNQFYPLVADLFTLLGLDCRESREGDNGARWDALIKDSEESIPIEIKSPTEELYLSLKAVRQALENKVILLSRETHPTQRNTSSLVVGYNLPNARAEVAKIIDDIYSTYRLRIGVIGLESLFQLAVSATRGNYKIDLSEIGRSKGIVNVDL